MVSRDAILGAMRMATSACEVPVIMFLMKSLWPGASRMQFELTNTSPAYNRERSSIVWKTQDAWRNMAG